MTIVKDGIDKLSEYVCDHEIMIAGRRNVPTTGDRIQEIPRLLSSAVAQFAMHKASPERPDSPITQAETDLAAIIVITAEIGGAMDCRLGLAVEQMLLQNTVQGAKDYAD